MRFTWYPKINNSIFLLLWQNNKCSKLLVSNQNASVSVPVSFRWERWDWRSLQLGHCFVTRSRTYQGPTALFEPTKSRQPKERPYYENTEIKPMNSFHTCGAPEFAHQNFVHSSLQSESAQRNNRVKPESTEILPILQDTRKSHGTLSGRILLFCGTMYSLNPAETSQDRS